MSYVGIFSDKLNHSPHRKMSTIRDDGNNDY